MATPSFSGNFLTVPEGGAEYGVDYGAPGLLGAPVVSPVAGTVLGYQPSSGGSPGWDPGRLLIQAVDGTIVGIGHITSTLRPGTMLQAGQSVGTVGNSSFYGGTAESNAHIEVMSGTSTSTFKSGGQAKVLADEVLATAALGGGSVGSALGSVGQTTSTQGAVSTGGCQSLTSFIDSNAHGSSIPVVGGVVGAITGTALFPVAVVEWSTQPCVRWTAGFWLLAFGLGGLGFYLLFRKQADAAIGQVGKAAAIA